MKLSHIEKILIVATLIMFGVFFCRNAKNINFPNENTERPNIDLGFTVEEFKSAYNQNVSKRNIPQLMIKDFEFGTGESSDTFGYKFIDTFYLAGTVNPKTGKIQSLHILKAFVLGNERKTEMQVAGIAFLIMVQTLSPELNAEERAAILDKFSASSKKYVSVTKGNICYSQMFEDKILTLSATVKKKNNPAEKRRGF